jgi:hypothetical protein
MKRIRHNNTSIASILFIAFSIILLPGCTYKFHSWGYEQDVIQTLESGDKVSVKMKNGDNYKLKIITIGQFGLRGTDKQKQVVEIPLSETDYVRKGRLAWGYVLAPVIVAGLLILDYHTGWWFSWP